LRWEGRAAQQARERGADVDMRGTAELEWSGADARERVAWRTRPAGAGPAVALAAGERMAPSRCWM
jgi:hypothetical protein